MIHRETKDERSLLTRILLVILLILFLSGCNLLGITPQRRPSPDASKEKTATTKSENKAIQEERTLLLQRIEALEARLEQDRADYQEKLKRMDRTVSLLEKSILQLKQKADQQLTEQPKQRRQESAPPPVQQKQAKATKQAQLPKKSKTGKPTGPTGDIRTPQTSKAIETVSLLKPDTGKKRSTSAERKKSARKLPIIGIEQNAIKGTKPSGHEAWEDPDLEVPPSPIQLDVISGAKRRYQQAFKVYTSRNYEESIKQFNTFLSDFPNDQDADNSQFWIGQSHFQLGNYLHAERSFRKVLRNYGHGSTRRGFKTPDAILMLGRIYLIRKKPIKARYYFEQVTRRYPGSRSAVKATREIEAMDSF